MTDVVITVPAYFGFRERNATREAAINAGWNPIALLDEPTAAAIMYGQNRNQSSLLTVVDLGGGTFDVTVLEYT
ncbi:Hsp70 family protein, partial [Acinetobacter baumannii]